MRKMYLSTIMVFVLSLLAVSCNNKNSVDDQLGEPIKINLKLQGTSSTTKAIGDIIDEDNVVNDLLVYIVRDDGSIDAGPLYYEAADLANGTDVPTIIGTTRATKVYVICNTGPLATGPFYGMANLAQLERVAASLDGNTNVGSQCVSGNVWMSGSSTLIAAGLVNGTISRTATVNLKYIPAKVYVVIENNMTNYSAAGNTILDGVMMLNAGAWTRFIESSGDFKPLRTDITTPNNVPFFYNGRTVSFVGWQDEPALVNGQPDFAVRSFMDFSPAPRFPITTAPTTVSPLPGEGFYVFPSITTNLTYVSIYGRFDANGATQPSAVERYWTLAFGGQDGLAAPIVSGEQYVVTFELNGNANNGGGGSGDPSEEAVNVDVDITVVPAVWDVKLVRKVIN